MEVAFAHATRSSNHLYEAVTALCAVCMNSAKEDAMERK
jgi:hypothetical protein